MGFDVGDGRVVGLADRLQRVPAEDRCGGAADTPAAGVGVVPRAGEGLLDYLVDLLGQVPLGHRETLWRVVADDPGQYADVVFVHDYGLIGVPGRVDDGARDLQGLRQEVQGILGVLDDPVPQLAQPLGEGGVLRRAQLDALVEGGLDGVQDLRRRRWRSGLVAWTGLGPHEGQQLLQDADALRVQDEGSS